MNNSKGLRIPLLILDQTGIKDDVEIKVEENQIIIRPGKNVREGWDTAFKRMGGNNDDEPIIDDQISHSWDEKEWQ